MVNFLQTAWYIEIHLMKQAQNFKRCSECDIYIKYDGNRCPCCKIHLETKEDQLQINSHYILIKDIEIIRNKI